MNSGHLVYRKQNGPHNSKIVFNNSQRGAGSSRQGFWQKLL